MARPRRNTEQLEPTKNTKEEIEAALARASGGNFEQNHQVNEPKDTGFVGYTKPVNVTNVSKPTIVKELDEGNGADLNDGTMTVPICAKDCFNKSANNPDKTIVKFVSGINKKIDEECNRGGYSTNVVFRVNPNDWINVQHIVDLYRANGFDVSVSEPSHSPYGQNVGNIEYDILISWVNAH